MVVDVQQEGILIEVCLLASNQDRSDVEAVWEEAFRAIDPPNPARGFTQQNENVRLATAACMQKYGNVSFATVACAKCMRYGGGTIPLGSGLYINDLPKQSSVIPNVLVVSTLFNVPRCTKVVVQNENKKRPGSPLVYLD